MRTRAIERRKLLSMCGGATAASILGLKSLGAQQQAKIHCIFWASTESQPDPFVDGFARDCASAAISRAGISRSICVMRREIRTRCGPCFPT